MNKPIRHRRPSLADRRARHGAYTVEFAICSLVFFMTIFACLELSRLMYVRQALDQTAYESARIGVVSGTTQDQVISRASTLLQAYGVSFASINVVPETFDETTREVTVTITSSFSENSWIPQTFVTGDEMVATVTLDHENQAFLVPADAANDDVLQDNDEPLDE